MQLSTRPEAAHPARRPIMAEHDHVYAPPKEPAAPEPPAERKRSTGWQPASHAARLFGAILDVGLYLGAVYGAVMACNKVLYEEPHPPRSEADWRTLYLISEIVRLGTLLAVLA